MQGHFWNAGRLARNNTLLCAAWAVILWEMIEKEKEGDIRSVNPSQD